MGDVVGEGKDSRTLKGVQNGQRFRVLEETDMVGQELSFSRPPVRGTVLNARALKTFAADELVFPGSFENKTAFQPRRRVSWRFRHLCGGRLVLVPLKWLE